MMSIVYLIIAFLFLVIAVLLIRHIGDMNRQKKVFDIYCHQIDEANNQLDELQSQLDDLQEPLVRLHTISDRILKYLKK